MNDEAVAPGSPSEDEYEQRLADWLAEGLAKPGKLSFELAKLLNIGASQVSKMKFNKRKILAYQAFMIASYIEEPIPVPVEAQVRIKSSAIPIIGEAGRSAWYDGEPQSVQGDILQYLPDDRFKDVPHFATKVVGEDVNTIMPDGCWAVYVPYLSARKAVQDQDFVLIRQVHRNGGLHKRLIRQVISSPQRQEFRGASFDPKVNAAATIRMADDLSHVAGSTETIEIVGLVVAQCRRIPE